MKISHLISRSRDYYTVRIVYASYYTTSYIICYTKLLYISIVLDMLQHVTLTFKENIFYFKYIVVTCCNMSNTVLKYSCFNVTCSS